MTIEARLFVSAACDRNVLAERLGIKVDYADWLLDHARKVKRGIIRVVVSDKNNGRESASIQAHHYRYVLDDALTPATRHYVEAVIARYQTVNPDIPIRRPTLKALRIRTSDKLGSNRPYARTLIVNGPGLITVGLGLLSSL